MPPVIAAIAGIATSIGLTGTAAGETLPEGTEFAPSGWPVIKEAETENAVED